MPEQIRPIPPCRDVDAMAAFRRPPGFKGACERAGRHIWTTRDRVETPVLHHPPHRPAACDHGARVRPEDVDGFSAGAGAPGPPDEGAFATRRRPDADRRRIGRENA